MFGSKGIVGGKQGEEVGEVVELAGETVVGCVDLGRGKGVAAGDGGAAVGGGGGFVGCEIVMAEESERE